MQYFFKNLRITVKFIVWFLLISLVPLAISIYVSYNNSRKVLVEEVEKSLLAVADNKTNQIESYLIRQKKNGIASKILFFRQRIIPKVTPKGPAWHWIRDLRARPWRTCGTTPQSIFRLPASWCSVVLLAFAGGKWSGFRVIWRKNIYCDRG